MVGSVYPYWKKEEKSFSLGGQEDAFPRTSAMVALLNDRSRKAEALKTL